MDGAAGVGGALAPGPAPSSSVFPLQRPPASASGALPVRRYLKSITTRLYPVEPR